MFSSKAQLKRRTPENGTDRESFLSLLVDEYLNTSVLDAKCQVLANLANFSYDPINFAFIRNVGVLDIFLHVVKTEKNQTLLHYASAGLCNLSVDAENAEYILHHAGLKPIIELLKSENHNTVLNIITCLIYMLNEKTQSEICTESTVQEVKKYINSEDRRISNLATIFLQDLSQRGGKNHE